MGTKESNSEHLQDLLTDALQKSDEYIQKQVAQMTRNEVSPSSSCRADLLQGYENILASRA
jgi:hypothetical protein